MNSRKSIFFLIILMMLFLGAGITISAQADLTVWKDTLLKNRTEKDRDFKTSLTSPMAGTERLHIEKKPGANTFITDTYKGIVLTSTPSKTSFFVIHHLDEGWKWESLNADVTCSLGDKKVVSGFLPSETIRYTCGRYTMTVSMNKEKNMIILIVFDSQRPLIQSFKNLIYFAPDPKYRVNATFEKYPAVESFQISTSRNETKTYYKYGFIKFALDEKEYRLEAFKFSLDKGGDDSNYLFIPFSDATSGKETYEVGRFMDVMEPVSGSFILDFNECYNPLCNYAPVYNCPIPPLSNHLPIEIKAGEKVYPHH